jgi:hypothetical protein
VLTPTPAPFCGDGITQDEEICDGGIRACGACSADCETVISDVATGLILAAGGAAYVGADRFTLSDGITSTTFEFTTTGTVGGGRTPILVVATPTPDTAAQVAVKIDLAISASTLHITTRVVGGAVLLTNQRATATGNITIDDKVVTSTFAVDGMTGGQGGQCLVGAPCKTGLECASNQCVTGLCVDP